jgi:hypothetical protein
MSFWDGSRWRTDAPVRDPALSRRSVRVWIATVIMIAGFGLLVVPRANVVSSTAVLNLSPSTGSPGVTVSVTGSGFPAQIRVQLTWDGATKPLPAVRVDRRGQLKASFSVPASAAGAHAVAAFAVTSKSNGKSATLAADSLATATFTVAASPTPSDPASSPPSPSATPTPTPAPTTQPTAAPTANPSPPDAAGTLYVSTTGSDANPGTSALPWRTLQNAADTVAPGSTVYLRSGTYAGFRMTRSGTSDAPITFASYPGEQATVSGGPTDLVTIYHASGIVLDQLRITGASRFAVLIEASSYVTVRDSVITGSANGVRIRYGGAGVLIEGNRIYGNDRMVVNDPGGNNDYGAQGVAFQFTTGPVVVRNNLIYGHHAASYDYGTDGAGFEIFGASNLTIAGNVLWDDENILETGTDGTHACNNITFTRNIAYNAGHSKGLVLRCASNSLFAHNTIDGLIWYSVLVDGGGGTFGGSISGLRLADNSITTKGDKIYSFKGSLAGVSVDYDLVWNAAGGTIATVNGVPFTSLAPLTSLTGVEAHGLLANPDYMDPATRDYRLASTSPAIDAGVSLPGWTALGGGPDIGRYEMR